MPADQVPGSGQFLLYPNIPPMLLAGQYVLNAAQAISATDHAASALPVDDMDVHLDVRSPRFTLPPDQVLSTFPPAESEGSYGSRLPQVVIKRRTLPWERRVAGAPTNPVTPFLALVVVAEGEAKLVPNVPAADVITRGVTLAGATDVDVGNCLEIKQSMVQTIFPTRKDVPLLAHARHVDINDTEMMMGDDDGFLAVVVANRLPLAGRDADGNEVPVKYTACLVNLEGQWDALLPTAPPPRLTTVFAGLESTVMLSTSGMDKHLMGGPVLTGVVSNAVKPLAPAANLVREIADVSRDVAASAQTKTSAGFGSGAGIKGSRVGEVSGVLATEKVRRDAILEALDPVLRFPVLLHWRFTTTGSATFESLMKGLDSGMLGTIAKKPPADDAGRLPLELVDTGHVGLEQKTRRGDSVRAWYRGPFVPHPTDDSPAARLPLAHAADQLRVVIPDGREDLSLASAFEIGRLLALANPNMVAALLRWRQLHYVTVRRSRIWAENAALLGSISGYVATKRVSGNAAVELSRAMLRAVTNKPDDFMGQPRGLVDPGRELPFSGDPNTLMARAFALPALRGDPRKILTTLQDTPVRVAPITEKVGRVPGAMFTELDTAILTRTLDTRLDRLVTEAVGKVAGPQSARKGRRGARGGRTPDGRTPDALDEVITRLSRDSKGEGDA